MLQTKVSIIAQICVFSISLLAGILVTILLVILNKNKSSNKISQEVEKKASLKSEMRFNTLKKEENITTSEVNEVNNTKETLELPDICSIAMDSEIKPIDTNTISEDLENRRRYSRYFNFLINLFIIMVIS